MHKRARVLFGCVAALMVLGLLYAHYFGPVNVYAEHTQFIVPPDASVDDVGALLESQGYVRSALAFRLALVGKVTDRGIRPGGYDISAAMDTCTIGKTLTQLPYLRFVTLPEGVRKEQIADILSDALFWSDAQKQEWLTVDTAATGTLAEGDYYPDVYL